MSENNDDQLFDNGGNEANMEDLNDAVNGGDAETGNVHVPKNHVPFNVNSYATHKTITAGAMDVALLTSNATQLKMLNASVEKTNFQIGTMSLLILCIVLQIVVVFLIILMGSSNIDLTSTDAEQEKFKKRIEKKNKAALALVALITIINILASAFAGDLTLN